MPQRAAVRRANRQQSICYRRRLPAVAVLVAALTSVAAWQEAAPASFASRMDAVITAAQKRLQIPGISVAVHAAGAVQYAKAFGFADLEHQVPATQATKFRTASVAKPITATAVMQLAERGQIDIDAPVQKYCPAFPAKPWPVSARQLLGHLAGVRHYAEPGESAGTAHFFTLSDSLRLFKDDPLLHEPGTKYEYSTYGYNVLGCAIEGASHSSYVDFVQQHIIGPAGMTHTAVDDLYLIVPGRARGYQLMTAERYASLPAAAKTIAKPNTVYHAGLHDTSMKLPGGGWVSTPADLVRFGAALLNGTLVKPTTRDEMWTSQKTRTGEATNYGLGFGATVAASRRVAVTHTGNQTGASSVLMMSPADRRVLAIMSNLEDAPLSEIAREVIRLVNEAFAGR